MPTVPMRSSTTSGHNTPPTAPHSYSPSVPLSVYRELAAELQAAEAKLDFLNAHNQELAKQNQQLRQEIEKAVQSALQLQQRISAVNGGSRTYNYYPTNNFRSEPSRPLAGQRPISQNSRSPSGVQSAVKGSSFFTEEEERPYRRRFQPERTSEVSGWGLAIAILLIVATAFGAGFLIVRPLLQMQSR